ncbi:hypothetical protein ACFQ34_21225 [Pseudonocardia benzenivorans]|uniref:Uncharacterized protein n=1 Tax=Pseudonocardia benzenivorans TaxID=228005 RepID=A0ABW3VKY1_9PSEU
MSGARSSPLDMLTAAERDLLRPARAAFVAPMPPTLTADHFCDPDRLFERKLDEVLDRAPLPRVQLRRKRDTSQGWPDI